MKITIKEIDEKYKLEKFDCKTESINNYLKISALYDSKFKLAITKVILIDEDIFGFYSLSITEFFNYEEDIKYYGLNLDYIAVDKNYQSKGIGSKILEIVVAKSLEISNEIGCRYLVLDALNEKVSWYEERGFEKVGEVEEGKNITTRMVMDFADLEYIENLFNI